MNGLQYLSKNARSRRLYFVGRPPLYWSSHRRPCLSVVAYRRASHALMARNRSALRCASSAVIVKYSFIGLYLALHIINADKLEPRPVFAKLAANYQGIAPPALILFRVFDAVVFCLFLRKYDLLYCFSRHWIASLVSYKHDWLF